MVKEESLRWNPGRGILKKDSLRRSLRGGILEEESWKNDPRRTFGATSRELWRDTQEPSEGIWGIP